MMISPEPKTPPTPPGEPLDLGDAIAAGSLSEAKPEPKHSWEYRVFERQVGDQTEYYIGEVYYEDFTIIGWTGPVRPGGETVEELIGDLTLMKAAAMDAMSKPVLDAENMELGA